MSKPVLGESFEAPSGSVGIVAAIREGVEGVFVKIGNAYAEWESAGVASDEPVADEAPAEAAHAGSEEPAAGEAGEHPAA